MQLLEDRIRRNGTILPGEIVKVDSFLNHQMDVALFQEMGKEFYRLFGDRHVNKILTVEASGIGIACIAAQYFGCPVVFAKKSKSGNVSDDRYHAEVHSYTHGNSYDMTVSREYLRKEDRVLLIDDFLAMGEALKGLISIVHQAGAEVVGCGVCVEKAFQPGGDLLRAEGFRVESLARIASASMENGFEFC